MLAQTGGVVHNRGVVEVRAGSTEEQVPPVKAAGSWLRLRSIDLSGRAHYLLQRLPGRTIGSGLPVAARLGAGPLPLVGQERRW